MFVKAFLDLISEYDAEPALIADLIAIYPEGRQDDFGGRAFRCDDLSPGDPTLRRLVERIEAAGYTLGTSSHGNPKHLFMSHVRTYEDQDCDGLAWVQPGIEYESMVDTYYRDDEGRIRVKVGSLKRRVDFASDITQTEFFVPTRVKDLLEAAGLRGLGFREAAPVRGDFERPARWKRPGEELWELTSPVRMPPVSPRMDCRDEDGNPVDPATHDGPVLFSEGLYRPVELRYTARSLRGLPPTDLARLHEKSTSKVDDMALIASARFRAVCREHGLVVDWIPVRIDD